jgi:hypothetical protein
MTTTTKPINELHAENVEWQSRLDFYADEIKMMEGRIAEIASKNTAKEVQAHVEHFQNHIVINKNHIDELRHDIRDHESFIVNRVKENPVAVDHRQLNDHPVLRSRMASFENIFNALRKELDLFAAQLM